MFMGGTQFVASPIRQAQMIKYRLSAWGTVTHTPQIQPIVQFVAFGFTFRGQLHICPLKVKVGVQIPQGHQSKPPIWGFLKTGTRKNGGGGGVLDPPTLVERQSATCSSFIVFSFKAESFWRPFLGKFCQMSKTLSQTGGGGQTAGKNPAFPALLGLPKRRYDLC